MPEGMDEVIMIISHSNYVTRLLYYFVTTKMVHNFSLINGSVGYILGRLP